MHSNVRQITIPWSLTCRVRGRTISTWADVLVLFRPGEGRRGGVLRKGVLRRKVRRTYTHAHNTQHTHKTQHTHTTHPHNTPTHKHTETHRNTNTHKHTHKHTQTHTNTNTQTQHTHTRTHTQTQHTHKHTHTHTNTQTHTQTQTHTNTHSHFGSSHAPIQTFKPSPEVVVAGAVANVQRLEADNVHAKGLQDALRVARSKTKVPPISELVEACKTFIERAKNESIEHR